MTAAVLALLLAAPERVVVVAKKAEPPGFLARVGKSLRGIVRGLYERDDDDVALGNARLAQDDPEGALREYDKARARLPDDPGVAFDRAATLLRLDPSKAGEAAGEAGRALQAADAALKPKAAYQLALATESMGQPDEAVRQYGAALALDPDDVDSKVNLELLLRTQRQPRQNPMGKPREDQPRQQGAQQKPEPQKGDAPRKQEQSAPQKASPGQQPDPQQKDDPQGHAAQQQQGQNPEQKPQAATPETGSEKPLDRTEAQRLLDALRASEKNLEIWRFAKKKTEVRTRSDPEKDW
jgi:tetratricopeptide (TPR) repeat protein